jgi:hypothetical protein
MRQKEISHSLLTVGELDLLYIHVCLQELLLKVGKHFLLCCLSFGVRKVAKIQSVQLTGFLILDKLEFVQLHKDIPPVVFTIKILNFHFQIFA